MRQRTGAAILTEEDVLRIRAAADRSGNLRDLAAFYGVALGTIKKIVRRESWAWVGEESLTNNPVIGNSAPMPPMSPELEAQFNRDLAASGLLERFKGEIADETAVRQATADLIEGLLPKGDSDVEDKG